MAFLRISLYLPTTQLLTAKIHTSVGTRKGSCSCSFLLVSVWSELFFVFCFCLPIFLKYYNFQQFSLLLSFLFTSFMSLSFRFTLYPTALAFSSCSPACNSSSSPSCLHPPFPTDTLRDRLLPNILGQCFKLAFRESLLSTCRHFR